MNSEKNKPIAIWGTDVEAAQIYYELRAAGYEIQIFFDNRIEKEITFLNIPVKKPNEQLIKKYFIYVACKYETYFAISSQLEQMGRHEIKDFIYYKCFGKKIALIYGNCHTRVIREYLEKSEAFIRQYAIYPLPVIQNIKKGFVEDALLKACDLFIYMPIRENNRFGIKLSTEYLLQNISRAAKRISFPNLFGLGYGFFPLREDNFCNEYIRRGENTNGIFPSKIRGIDEMIEKGFSDKEIFNIISDENLLPEYEIKTVFNIYNDKIRERENQTDVKILDYILENYKFVQIFYDPNHPTNAVVKEMVYQILDRLKINTSIDDQDVHRMDEYEEPILPCVKKALLLEYGKGGYIRSSKNGIKLSSHLDLEGYIKQYVFWKKCSEE